MITADMALNGQRNSVVSDIMLKCNNRNSRKSSSTSSPLALGPLPVDMKRLTVDPGVPVPLRRKSHSGDGMASEDFLEAVSKVLVLYTGGTIGMKSRNGVYVPEPHYLANELRRMPLFHDPTFPLQFTEDNGHVQTLVLPANQDSFHIQELKRVVYVVDEYDPIIDSSNMNHDDYGRLTKDIQDNYTKYDGFVILHGTDTMAYTASALSFMLENLGKPVILTGSQIPIFELRSDGRNNFIGAVILAAGFSIPEVSIYFNNYLLRGNRSTKVDTDAMAAFESFNMEPLVKVEIHIKVNHNAIFRHRGMKKFHVHTNMCPDVGVLRLFPSITNNTVKAFLQPPMKGVILQTYGVGNGPTARHDLMNTLKEATERGVIIVSTTQCPRGSVTPAYAVGKELEEVGVIPGLDMTVEASLMKLSYVLGQDDLSLEEKRNMMGVNLRGEMSVAKNANIRHLQFQLIDKLADAMMISTSEESELLREAVFPYLLCAAARDGSIDGLKRLHEAGASYSVSDYDGRTALHVACCEGHIEVVRYLLECGASVHSRDRYGETPLENAIQFKRLDVIPLLRETGAHLNVLPGKLATNICSAAVNDDMNALVAWQLAGADFNLPNYDNRTPLHIAVSNGLEDQVRYLLENGADVTAVDFRGKTPVDEAEEKNLTNILKMLNSPLNGTKRTTGK